MRSEVEPNRRSVNQEEWRAIARSVVLHFLAHPAPRGCAAEDLVQEALLRSVGAFGHDALESPEDRRRYVLRIARNVWNDAYRDRRRRRFEQCRGGLQEMAGVEEKDGGRCACRDTTAEVELEDVRIALVRTLESQLDPTALQFFLLTRWDGQTVEEARLVLGLGSREVEAVRRRIRRFLSAASCFGRLVGQLDLRPDRTESGSATVEQAHRSWNS